MMDHVFNYDVATFLQRLNLAIQILIIFPLVSLFTLPCCKALFISLCLLYVDMKNILGGNSNDSYIHTVSLFVFKRQFPPKSCIKATFSKGRSLAAAFSGVEDTGIYLSCHGGLEGFLWIVPAGDVKLENPHIFRHCIILCNFFRMFFLLHYSLRKEQISEGLVVKFNKSSVLRIIKVSALCK